MSSRFRFLRRPSASMIVSLAALFVALGGVGYAAFQLPPNSVGTAQLRDGAVTNHKLADSSVGNHKLKFGSVGPRKLELGAVGLAQINSTQVQARVVGSCSGVNGAIGAIGSTGTVTCNPTLPALTDTTAGPPVTLISGTPTQVAGESLSGASSYLVFADPDVTISSGTPSQGVEVTCTLADPATGDSRIRTYSIETTKNASASSPETYRQTIPLIMPAPQLSGGSAVGVSCADTFTGSTPPTVTVASDIVAIQTASDN